MRVFMALACFIAIPGYIITALDVDLAMWESGPLSVWLVWMSIALMCFTLIKMGVEWIRNDDV